MSSPGPCSRKSDLTRPMCVEPILKNFGNNPQTQLPGTTHETPKTAQLAAGEEGNEGTASVLLLQGKEGVC